MKKTVKRALAMLLCFVMLSGVSPLNALAEVDFSRLNISLPEFRLPEFNLFGTKAAADGELPVSGYCGYDSDGDGEPDYNLIWQFWDYDTSLHICGEGAMQNYSLQNPAPWSVYKNVITAISIEDTVTTLGDYAFFDFANYSFTDFTPSSGSYSIGGTVTSDILWQFDTGLHKLSVEGSGAIPDYSAADRAPWSALLCRCGEIEIDSSITAIGDYAFFVNYEWYSLQELDIPQSVVSIGDYAFYGACLRDVNIPQTVTSVGENVFGGFGFDCYDGTAIVDVWTYDYSQKVLYVGNEYTNNIGNYSLDDPAPWYAFRDEVESIEFTGESLYIGDYAFYDFTALTDLFIPINVRKLGKYAFGRSFNAYNDSNFEYNLTEDIAINSPLSSMPQYNIYYVDMSIKMQGLKKVFFKSQNTALSKTTFDNCFSLEEVYFPGDSSAGFSVYDSSNHNFPDEPDDPIESVKVRYKDYCMQYLNRNFTSAASATGVSNTFQVMISVYKLFGIENQLENRLNNIFIINSGFYTPRYPNITYDEDGFIQNEIITVNYNCISGKDGNCFWYVQQNVLYILGEGVCGDGEQPVVDNYFSSVDTISFSDGITAIADNAFCNFRTIKYLESPGGVQSIGENAFGTPSGTFKNPDGSTPKSINFEYQYEYYIAGYDEESRNTGNYTTPSEYWLIKTRAVDNYTVSSYTVKGKTSIIAGGALKPNSEWANYLTEVTLPSSVDHIGKNAFEKCVFLETVNYYGTNTDWNNIVIEEGNDPLLNVQRVRPPFTVPVYINGVDDGTATGFCEWNEDGTITLTISAEEQDSYRMTITGVGFDTADVENSEELIRVLKIKEPFEGIDTDAFRNLTNLESITMPDSIRNIHTDAFAGSEYYSNESNWENGVLYIGDCLVKADPDIAGTYTVKDGTRLIADSAFAGCTNLTGVTVPGSVEIIGKEAFNNCVKLADITLPGSLRNIGEHAFANTAYYNNYANWTVTNISYRELYISGCLIDVERYQSNRDYYPVRIDAACVADCAFAKIVDNNGKCDIYVLNENTVFSDNAFSGLNFTSNDSGSKVYYYGTRDDWNNSNSRLGYDSSLQCIYEGGYFTTSSTDDNLKITGLNQPLRALKIPGEINGKTVTEIAYQAFKGRQEIDSIYICGNYIFEKKVLFGYKTFADCKNISYIYFDKILSEIDKSNHPFYNVGSDTDGVILEFGENVTIVKSGAFNLSLGVFRIKKLIIPANVTTIEQNAFSFIGTTAGPIGGGYDYEFGWTDCMPENAFYNMSSLKSITLPEGVISIGSSTFSGCTALTNVTLPSTVTSIGNSTFSRCAKLESINIPAGVTSIGTNAFGGIFGIGLSKLKTVNYYGTIKDWCNISFANRTANPINSSKKLLINGVEVTEIKETDIYGITEIKPYAFYGMTGLTNVTLPGSVTSIGDSAFYGCTALTNVTLLGTVTSIGDSAFYGCTALTNVTLPGTVTSIGTSAFYGCTKLESINIPEGITSISSSTFSGCTALTNVTLPGTVTSIGSSAFYGCTALTGIELSKGVISIGNSAFYGCTALANIALPVTVTSIGESAFYGCTATDTIVIPDSVTSIGKNAFRDVCHIVYNGTGVNIFNLFLCGARSRNGFVDGPLVYADDSGTKLLACMPSAKGTVVIPASVEEIKDYAFLDCKNIDRIIFKIRYKQPTFNDNIFSGMSSFKYEFRPYEGGVITGEPIYGDNGTRLIFCNKDYKDESFTVPGKVTVIEDNAFAYCKNNNQPLNVVIPENNNILSVGKNAFAGVKVNGTPVGELVWQEEESGNFEYRSVAGILLEIRVKQAELPDENEGEETPNGDGNDEEPEDIEFIVPEGITCIAAEAFAGFVIQKLKLPSTLKGISSEAFSGCSSLTEVEASCNNLMHIGKDAFASTGILENNSTLYVGSGLVCGAPDENGTLTVKDGTTCVAEYAACNSEALKKVIIPVSVANIGNRAFESCPKLEEITLSEGVSKIGKYAFANSAISSVTLPASLNETGYCAFYGCNNLTEFNVAAGNENVFAENGVLFAKTPEGGIALVQYPAAREGTEYTVPAKINGTDVTEIEDYAFSGFCSGIENEKGLVRIGDDVFYRSLAFYDCEAVRETSRLKNGIELSEDGSVLVQVTSKALEGGVLNIPDTVAVIAPNSITCKEEITSVNLNNTKIISEGVFSGCKNLSAINVEKVLFISDEAFAGCGIEEVKLSKGTYCSPTAFDKDVAISKNYIEINADNTTIRYGDKNGKVTLSTNLVPAEDERIVWVWTQYDFSESTESPRKIDRHEEGEELTILAVDPKNPHNNLQSSIFVTAYLVDEKDNVLFASEPQKITVTADISVPSDSITVKDEKGKVINDISVTVGKTITISLGDEFDELVKKYDKLAIEWYVNGKAAGNGTSCEIPVSDNNKPLKIKIKFSYNGKEITSVERTITIKNPTSGVIINAPAGEVYKNSVVTVTATATGIKANSGCVLAIFDGGKEVARGDNKSVSYRIPEEITANRTLAVKVVDKDGKVQKDSNGKELSGKIEIKVKTGFFDMLIAFFKKLFGANKVTIKP